MGEVVKYGIYLALSIAFIFLMIDAICDLQSGETGFTSSNKRGKSNMPSFTLCPWIGHKGLEYDQVLEFMNIENLTQAYMKVDVSRNHVIRLTDFSLVKNQTGFEVDELWSVHCKFYQDSNANCTPCITFNAPNDWSLDNLLPFSVRIVESEYQIENFGLSIHEKNQSDVVLNDLDMSNMQFFRLKSNTTGKVYKNYVMQKYLHMNKKSRPCDIKNEQNQEKVYYDFMNAQLGCNIPWSRYKSSNFVSLFINYCFDHSFAFPAPLEDCSTDVEMKEFFELARNASEIIEELSLQNCQSLLWKANDYYTDYTSDTNQPFASLTLSMMAFETKVNDQ